MRDDLRTFLRRAGSSSLSFATAAVRASDELAVPSPQLEQAQFTFQALRGRLIELSASGTTAVLSAAMGLVLEAQLLDEPVAWVTLRETCFYPPDVVDCGVDLAAMVVIRVSDLSSMGRAAERLLRSSAFGLVIVDLGALESSAERDIFPSAGKHAFSIANQGRLVTLASKNQTLVTCITSKNVSAESMSSLISLRADAARERDPEGLSVVLRVLKDKRRGPGWSRRDRAQGPAGWG
jgi:recombination protein RecA